MDERRRMLLDAEDNARALASANVDLEAANIRLAREAADQAQFLAVTAHELRAPIGVLSGSAQLLAQRLDELTAEERGELAESVASSADRLQRLLRDLLTAARLEAGVVRIEPQDVPLKELLAAAVHAARTAHPEATIDLEVGDDDLVVRGERDRLAQAVDNLIMNGLRHGRAPVSVSARDVGGRVEIRVSDAGEGVPPALRERLFERFASGTPRGGTGLGLFIVRELARAHGGDARYEEDGTGGPSFVIDLPANRRGAGDQPSGMP
jgi:signal transduction histidine kinase